MRVSVLGIIVDDFDDANVPISAGKTYFYIVNQFYIGWSNFLYAR